MAKVHQQNQTLFPHVAWVEHIPVQAFPNAISLFERICAEARKPSQSLIYYLNVHVANQAHTLPQLKSILQQGDVVYCDGMGIALAANATGQHIPTRLTAADWLIDLLAHVAQQNLTVFLLGGEPGVPEKAMHTIEAAVPNHTIVGMHHGYIHHSPEVEARVIERINTIEPDILIVGFGTPLQEFWIHQNRHRLNVSVIYATGAVLDFISGKVPHCPNWMGNAGLEWLHRLCVEPKRLFHRYVVGNPQFMLRTARCVLQLMLLQLSNPLQSNALQPVPSQLILMPRNKRADEHVATTPLAKGH